MQIIEGGKYSGISDKRRIRMRKIEAPRGTIYDRNGNVLAIDCYCFDLSVPYKNLLYGYLASTGDSLARLSTISAHKNNPPSTPKSPLSPPLSKGGEGGFKVDSCEGCHNNEGLWVKKISTLLGKPRSALLRDAKEVVEKVEKIKFNVERKHKKTIRIQEETLLYPVASNVDFEKAAVVEVNQRDFPGVSVEIQPLRWYPNRDLASHIVGYVGSRSTSSGQPAHNLCNPEVAAIIQKVISKRAEDDEDDKTNKYADTNGVAGIDGIEGAYDGLLCGMPGERFEEVILENLKVSKLILNKPPRSGYNIFLTIDRKIQKLAEDALGQRRGAIVVMNPWNGEILAMASYPRFDPNTFGDNYLELNNNPWKPFLSRPIQSTLPPGSVFKIVTSIAALSEDKINLDTTFNCTGKLKSTRERFRCYSAYGHGMVTLEEAIQYSCNPFFVEAGKSTGGPTLWTWASKFGFGKKTGIDLPYERPGNLPPFGSVYEVMNASLGQGNLLVTPLQVTIMMSAVANGGWVIKPHLLKKIVDNNGRTIFEKISEPRSWLNVPIEYQSAVQNGLRRVVTNGTARHAGLNELPVAGKTGTSETSEKDVNHAWFTGYVPFDRPEYCFTILAEHTTVHASDVAVPIAKKLVDSLLQREDKFEHGQTSLSMPPGIN
ncbi:MAG TPA: peptidoglycan D,D-transpeptidase FtsI family protein [Candidatus Brocadiia bacterium]|nr:penicillin-binding transpeptidase domain-containing protein [Candidatus Brocadiales bacterium]